MAEVGSLIIQLLKEIQNLGDSWYKATAAWKEFPQQVERLEEKLNIWENECTRRGLSSDAPLKHTLQNVKSVVEEELGKLKKKNEESLKKKKKGSHCAGCLPRLSSTLFPARLGESIQGAIDAVNNIQETVKLREEAGVAVAKLVQQESFSEPIVANSRYVPLKDSEKQIHEVLDNPEGPLVILLHGGPGKGKTTLAHNTAAFYKSKSDQRRFDHVFFLNCGPKARAEEIQFKLLQCLGFESSDTLQEDDKTKWIPIRRQIKALLSNRKVLIILDDVSDRKFLESIVHLCGDRVKCLVTSQEATLCLSLDQSKCHKIQIQDLNMEGAGKILASHVGLPNQQIPAHVQEVAEAMIQKTDYNPLAIASLANEICSERANELLEWEEASMNLFNALHSEVVAVSHDMFPRSFWSTTKLCLDKLSDDSRKLLLLIHACEGPSIPEEVVKVLYKGLSSQGNPGTFPHSARDELVNRQLVKITTVEARLSPSNRKVDLDKQRRWSLHSLLRLYIEKEMSQARDLLITSLIGSDRSNEGTQIVSQHEVVSDNEEVKDTRVLTTLCALYLDKPFASRARTQLCIPPENLSNIRRNAIEPITLLLGQPLSPRWTEKEHCSATKVFINYISKGTLQEFSVSHLLEVEIGANSMCIVLRDIATIGETCLLNENTRALMDILVSWLANDVSPSLQQEAASSFANLACGLDQIIDTIINHPRVLLELVNSLSKDGNPSFQVEATRALANLALGAHEIKDKIVNHPGVLLELVNSLSKDGNPNLQEEAARALANLAYGGFEIGEKIGKHEGVIAMLVKSLSKESRFVLQENAARAMCNLAHGKGNIMRLKETKGVMEGLVGLLPRTTKWHAAFVLALVDSECANEKHLQLASAYVGRVRVSYWLGLFKEAFVLFNKGRELGFKGRPWNSLRVSCALKAKAGDFEAAMVDANEVVNNKDTGHLALGLQERGTLKAMMGDFRGALVDLDKGLAIDKDDYEMLKQRGYVKFCLKDEEGARADAKLALKVKPSCDDDIYYEHHLCLGTSSVEYLGYKLR